MYGLFVFPEYRTRWDVLAYPLLPQCGRLDPFNSGCAFCDVLASRFSLDYQANRRCPYRKLSSTSFEVCSSEITV